MFELVCSITQTKDFKNNKAIIMKTFKKSSKVLPKIGNLHVWSMDISTRIHWNLVRMGDDEVMFELSWYKMGVTEWCNRQI